MEKPLIAIALAASASVDVVKILRVSDMDVEWIDSYDWSVLIVQVLDFPEETQLVRK